METDAELGAPYVEALVVGARRLGLRVDSPTVLRAGANVVVHLAPAPVVARIATMTAEMRDGALGYLERERDITRELVRRGIDVVAPTDLVDPGPHLIDGRAVLLLAHRTLHQLDRTAAADAEQAGAALAELTTALAELPAALATGDAGHPWPEIDRLLAAAARTYERATVDRIRTYIVHLRSSEPNDEFQLVHGDAHPGNVAGSDNGIIWFDFEDANRRPLAWDLASLRRSWPAAGDAACRTLGIPTDSETMRWHHELRDVYALLWSMLSAQRQRRARVQNETRLADWLERHP